MENSEGPLTLAPETFLERLTTGLVETGYAVFPKLLRPEVTAEVRAEMAALRAAGGFRSAGIGKGSGNLLHPETRGDGTYWFEADAPTAAQEKLAQVFGSIRERLNAELFLGLWDWEGHYAIYPPGAFYLPHVDRFASDSRRTVSMVFFFNPDWRPDDGGYLRLELPDGPLDVKPDGGTAVFFLSERIRHEVRATNRDRYSFAGWFRTR